MSSNYLTFSPERKRVVCTVSKFVNEVLVKIATVPYRTTTVPYSAVEHSTKCAVSIDKNQINLISDTSSDISNVRRGTYEK